MNTWAQPGRLRRPGRGLKTEKKSANSQFSRPPHTQKSGRPRLVRRDVRGFGAGRESGFVYHRARASLMPLAVLPWVTYLALPVSVHPLLILLPSAALLGLAVAISAATFKKYL